MEKCDSSSFSRPSFSPAVFATPFRQAVATALLTTLPIGCATTHASSKPAAPITTVATVHIPTAEAPDQADTDAEEEVARSRCSYFEKLQASQVSFKKVKDYHYGLAVAQDVDGWTYIDLSGNPLSAERFDYAEPFDGNVGEVSKNGELFYVNRQGGVGRKKPEIQNETPDPKKFVGLDVVGIFYDGMANASIGFNDYFVNETGHIQFQEDSKWIYHDFSEGFNAVTRKVDNKAAHVDESGQFPYSRLFKVAGDVHEGRAAMKDDSGWLHIFPDGHDAYSKRFMRAGDYNGGMAPAKDNSGWHHIDFNAKPVYPYRFNGSVGPFVENMSVTVDNGRWFHIGRSGKRYPNRKVCRD